MPNFPRFRVDEEDKCDPTLTSVFGDAVYYRRDLEVYPNPSDGRYTVQLPNDFTDGHLVVTDRNAAVVYQREVSLSMTEVDLKLYDLPDGVYNIELYPLRNKQRIFWGRQVVKVGH